VSEQYIGNFDSHVFVLSYILGGTLYKRSIHRPICEYSRRRNNRKRTIHLTASSNITKEISDNIKIDFY